MKLRFSQPLQVPEDMQKVKDSQVAFRNTQARKETYLTNEGYEDFTIRPSLELQIAPAPDSDPETLSFDWEVLEYTESYVLIQLLFDNPDALSALDGKSMDQVQVTFWGDNLFVGKNGKAVPNGLTVRRAVVRQVDPGESEWIERFAKNLGRVVLLTFTILLLAAHLFRADTFPLWSVFNTIILVVHFPLLNLQLPGNLSLFLKEFLNILRLKDLKLEK